MKIKYEVKPDVSQGEPLDLRETFLALEDIAISINKLLSLVSASRRSESDWDALLRTGTGDVVTEFVTKLLNNGITEIQPPDNGEPF